ncbi:MAG TPA: hypothetical protein PKE27_00070 [Povalibacter sp.]|uniref:hypothetical protein n=1 Tax=Povalibacter sp. TaxID=1962978 RepID=UPI002D0A29AF|nr:hypothetical protein [Povalibacter sp.]HMN42941.1 hypothetical protein [Povalibacter sp.]
MSLATVAAQLFVAEARDILAKADEQHRDLSEFESGRVETLLEVAERFSRSAPGVIAADELHSARY